MKCFTRICPECKRTLKYKRLRDRNLAIRNCRSCNKCCQLRERHWRFKHGFAGYKIRNCPKCGRKVAYSTRHGMLQYEREGRMCRRCSKLGRHNSEKTIQKIRERKLGRVTPAFNPVACKIIDKYGKKHGYKFQHALNGGEFRVIGYSVDGYDKKKNVVIEYYEKRHLKTRSRDAYRKRNIIKHLGCKFIELKEWEL